MYLPLGDAVIVSPPILFIQSISFGHLPIMAIIFFSLQKSLSLKSLCIEFIFEGRMHGDSLLLNLNIGITQ